jgi:hypothetical protein
LTAFSTAKKAPSPSISQASKPKVFTSKPYFYLYPKPSSPDTLVLPCLVVSQLALKFEVGRAIFIALSIVEHNL